MVSSEASSRCSTTTSNSADSVSTLSSDGSGNIEEVNFGSASSAVTSALFSVITFPQILFYSNMDQGHFAWERLLL
jgi:hypothetical protein